MKPTPLILAAYVSTCAFAAEPSTTFPAPNAGPHAAQAVLLSGGWEDAWRPTPTRITQGTLVALDVPAAWARPRDARQPVLMVDDRALPILWTSASARCVIGFVPDNRSAARFAWASEARLPEQIDAETGARFVAEASARGLGKQPIPRSTAAWQAPDDLAFDAMVEAFAAQHCGGR